MADTMPRIVIDSREGGPGGDYLKSKADAVELVVRRAGESVAPLSSDARIERDSQPAEVTAERKAQPTSTPTLTPNGWMPMGKILPGDVVVGGDGNPTKVLGVYSQGTIPTYSVTFSDGSETRCSLEHLWTVRAARGAVYTMPLYGIIAKLAENPSRIFSIPIAAPMKTPHADLPIDPYVLGVLIGDGCMRGKGVSFTSTDKHIVEKVASLIPPGMELSDWGANSYGIINPLPGYGPRNIVMMSLKALGLHDCLSHEKFIPPTYLFGSVEQRLSLLAGLMDSDGWACRDRASVKYATASQRLSDDVIHLARSLGCTVKKHTLRNIRYPYAGEIRHGRDSHVLSICLPRGLVPFSLPRKVESMRGHHKGAREPRRTIKGIRYCGLEESVCIEVQNETGLYVTENFIVTHNTWSDWEGCFYDRAVGQAADVSFLVIERPKAREVASWDAAGKDRADRARRRMWHMNFSVPTFYTDSPQQTWELYEYVSRAGSLNIRENRVGRVEDSLLETVLRALGVSSNRLVRAGGTVGQAVKPGFPGAAMAAWVESWEGMPGIGPKTMATARLAIKPYV